MSWQASAEIQEAARRVVNENKRLRQLLKQQGISDAEIDGMATEFPESAQPTPTAAQLESMLKSRKHCGRREAGGPSVPVESMEQVTSPMELQEQPPNLRKYSNSPYVSSTSTQTAGKEDDGLSDDKLRWQIDDPTSLDYIEPGLHIGIPDMADNVVWTDDVFGLSADWRVTGR